MLMDIGVALMWGLSGGSFVDMGVCRKLLLFEIHDFTAVWLKGECDPASVTNLEMG